MEIDKIKRLIIDDFEENYKDYDSNFQKEVVKLINSMSFKNLISYLQDNSIIPNYDYEKINIDDFFEQEIDNQQSIFDLIDEE